MSTTNSLLMTSNWLLNVLIGKKARELMDNATRNAIFRTCEDENIDLILQQVGETKLLNQD